MWPLQDSRDDPSDLGCSGKASIGCRGHLFICFQNKFFGKALEKLTVFYAEVY